MPATVTGLWFTSQDIEQLFVEAGHFTRAKGYNQTGSHKTFYASYAPQAGTAEEVSFVGGNYGVGKHTGLALYAAQFKELWQQYYLNLQDRKSTRLKSSHVSISYAVFCSKKKIRRTTGSNN